MTQWVYPAGRCSRDGWDVCLGAGATLQPAPQWQHTGLRAGHLKTGQEIQLDAESEERLFVPLAGSYTLTVEGKPSRTYELLGRPHVFAGPTDTVYVGTGTAVRVHCERSGGLAVASCPTEVTHPRCHIPAPAIPVELRGVGACSRQVHNLGVPGVVKAQGLLVCEVLTPAGNWSSYPPHKHDRDGDHESALEEIYYFEVRSVEGAPATAAPVGFNAYTLQTTGPPMCVLKSVRGTWYSCPTVGMGPPWLPRVTICTTSM